MILAEKKSGRHKSRKGNVCKAIKKILDLCDFVLYKAKVFCRGIAQLVEHRSPKPSVVSSNLTAPATFSPNTVLLYKFLFIGKVNGKN